MQQRQLRLGDILDDYCPRERRVTNHVVVAMVGEDVKQTRCSTCDAEHEFKHAKVPRQRRKAETPAAPYAQGAPGAPKRIPHHPEADVAQPPPASLEPPPPAPRRPPSSVISAESRTVPAEGRIVPAEGRIAPAENRIVAEPQADGNAPGSDEPPEEPDDEGPVHRPLIRA